MSDRGTILVVDDDRAISDAACVRLRAAGFKTVAAYDGQTGLDSAQNHHPRAILLDVRMPCMDGLAALAKLKRCAATKCIPVIMLSASICDEQAALDCGARFFVRKPYKGSQLLVALDCAIREVSSPARPTTSEDETSFGTQGGRGRHAGAPACH